jgi:glycogen synthase
VDCLTHGKNALLAEPGDAQSLAKGLRRILDDAPLRERLAEQALDEARTLYAWPAVAARIAAVYESLAETRPAPDWPRVGPVEPCRFRETPHLL